MDELLAFVRELRAAGLTIGTDRVAAAAEALGMMPGQPYWPLRVTLCARATDLLIFETVWHARSGDEPVQLEDAAIALTSGYEGTTAPDGGEPGENPPHTGAGGDTELGRRDFRTLTGQELVEVGRLITMLSVAPRQRPVMRRIPSRRGRIDARRTTALMLRNGGELCRVLRSRRGWRPRRLLMLIDISGSMADYREAMLRFAHAAVMTGPTTTEVFVIGTGFHRLTADLRGRDVRAVMKAIGLVETEWDGGTTLGVALRAFLRRWGGSTAVRSATAVFCSDGAEFGDLTELPRQVARLSRLAHSVVWVNPAQALPGYAPINPALVRSLRYTTDQVSGHNFESLRRLAEVISR